MSAGLACRIGDVLGHQIAELAIMQLEAESAKAADLAVQPVDLIEILPRPLVEAGQDLPRLDALRRRGRPALRGLVRGRLLVRSRQDEAVAGLRPRRPGR